jgi:hypothetical protein
MDVGREIIFLHPFTNFNITIMKVYIIYADSFWDNFEHIGGQIQGAYTTKELAEQVVSTLPEWSDDCEIRTSYKITEHELQGV